MSLLKHVAIIMDGNGRWAQDRLHSRIWGHVRGSEVVSSIVKAADELCLKTLTLYAFSTENWSRPKEEVSTLFKLLKKFLIKEKIRIVENNIRFKVIGELDGLPHDIQLLIKHMEDLTCNSTGLNLVFAFNYGGRTEILRAVNSFLLSNPGKNITEFDLNQSMYFPEAGDVDLLIRTGGEQRISNFLLWQMAYAEMYFTNTKWPDFSVDEFKKIIEVVSNRQRRFGNITEQNDLQASSLRAKFNKSLFNLNSGVVS